MAFLVSGSRGQELAGTAITSLPRGLLPGLPTARPIVDQLPASLQEDDFCRRMVSALDEVLAPVFATLDCFDSYLDPQLAPEDFVDWLAGWVGLEIDETWTLESRRQLIEKAVILYRIRGTAAALAAHVALYAGATPHIEENGACGWSQTAGSDMPGSPQPHLTVRLEVDDASQIRRGTVGRIIDANRPAHVPYALEVLERGAPIPTVEQGPQPDSTDKKAPGAVDLPGSEHIELAPPAPATEEEMESAPNDTDGGEPAG